MTENQESPFHHGETLVQTRLGVQSSIEPWARKVVRPFMPDQHRQFFEAQPFMVVAARDQRGKMWCSLFTGSDGKAGFVSSPNSTTLEIRARPVVGDALSSDALQPGSDFGMLGIELSTKRRNRANGRIVSIQNNTELNGEQILEFRLDQSFGNCPQYIKPRRCWSVASKDLTGTSRFSNEHSTSESISLVSDCLSEAQIDIIRSLDTLFVATGYRGDGEHPGFGCDASHRGGPRGWIDVKDNKTILLPDFSGNNHYNTIGNLGLDSRMGITFPLFESGRLIQLTGTAVVDFDEERAAAQYPGAKRIIKFSIDEVVVPHGLLPIRWGPPEGEEEGERLLRVAQKIKESDDVTSFVLRPPEGDDPNLWPFLPGQHLPISLEIDNNDGANKLLERTYSLSCGPDWGEYRISVKREPFGAASRHLHDNIRIGDMIKCRRPAGDFFLSKDECCERTVVLVSAGIGLTPMVSMLHSFIQSNTCPNHTKKCVWVHGARDSQHHPLSEEVKELTEIGGGSVEAHVAYSKPRQGDTDHDSEGRVDSTLLKQVVPDLGNAVYFLCGPVSFMADIQSGLEGMGVDPKFVQTEAF